MSMRRNLQRAGCTCGQLVFAQHFVEKMHVRAMVERQSKFRRVASLGKWVYWSSVIHAAVIVVQAHDVILAEVVTGLNFDEYEALGPGVLDAMSGTERNVNCFSPTDFMLDRVEGDRRPSGKDIPVFGATLVLLVTKAVPRRYLDPLDLVLRRIFKHDVAAPGRPYQCSDLHVSRIHGDQLTAGACSPFLY